MTDAPTVRRLVTDSASRAVRLSIAGDDQGPICKTAESSSITHR